MIAKIDSLVLDSSTKENFATEDFVKSALSELKEDLGGKDDEDVENQALQDLEVKIINLQEDVSSVESSIEDLSDKLDTSKDEIPPPPDDGNDISEKLSELRNEMIAKIDSLVLDSSTKENFATEDL